MRGFPEYVSLFGAGLAGPSPPQFGRCPRGHKAVGNLRIQERSGKFMIRMRKLLPGMAMALSVLAIAPQPAFAQVRVMTSGGFAAPLREMLPEFEKSTGLSVQVILGKSQGGGPDTISAQLGRGVARRHRDPVARGLERSCFRKPDCRPFRHRPGQDTAWPGRSGRRAEAGYQHRGSLQEYAAAGQVDYLSQQHHRHLHGHQALSASWELRTRSFRKAPMPASPPSPRAMPKSPFSR